MGLSTTGAPGAPSRAWDSDRFASSRFQSLVKVGMSSAWRELNRRGTAMKVTPARPKKAAE
jgi:hypothetical protein